MSIEPLTEDELAAVAEWTEAWESDPSPMAKMATRGIRRLIATVRAREKALRDMTAGRDYLKRREQDIIEACERVADGGQYRADIVSAIQRIRRERDGARAELDAWKSLACARGRAMTWPIDLNELSDADFAQARADWEAIPTAQITLRALGIDPDAEAP